MPKKLEGPFSGRGYTI